MWVISTMIRQSPQYGSDSDGTSFHKVAAPERSLRTLCYAPSMVEHDDGASLQQSYARLLSLAVHEFRTPASVVAGYLRMLQHDGDQPLSDRQRKMIDEAEKSCARLVNLITELSEVSKLDGGTAPFKDQPMDLFEFVREVAAGVHEAREREVKLAVCGETSGARLTADPMRMRAAFEAFFRAILREQPNRVTVVADCRKDPDGSAVVVVARDTDVQRSYDAARGPLEEKRGGLGLLLPIASRVVARYGGRVWSPPGLAGESESESERRRKSALIISFPL